MKNLKLKRLHPDAVVPKYAKVGDSGFDLVAIEDMIFYPGETKLVKTGWAVEIEPGFELQVRPRSGLSLRTKLRVVFGTVDRGFRGDLCVIVENTDLQREDGHGNIPSYKIKKGDRIAQGVIAPVVQVSFEIVEELSDTERGSGGFGSSGL